MENGISVDYLVTLVEQEHPEDTLASLSVIKWERYEETGSTVQ